jgi:hypothetical protein
MMPTMRLTRPAVVLAAAAATVAGLSGPAAASGSRPVVASHAAAAGRTAADSLRARAAAELSQALLIARSSGVERRRALVAAGTAAAAGTTPVIPTPGSLTLLESACSIDEGGGSSSGSSSGSGSAARSAGDATLAAATPHAVLEELIPAGHLSGPAGSDVLDYRLAATPRIVSAGITARSARTGAPLWSRTVTGTKNSLPPFPDADRVGAAHRPGVLLVDESIPLFENGTHASSLTVTAISGAGKTLWRKTLTGSISSTSSSITETDVPVLVGDIHERKGSGHDLLIDIVNETTTFSSLSDSGEVEPDVLSATDGSVTPVGTPLTSSAGAPLAVPVPDLNHDGLDDVAISVPGTRGKGHIVTERGNTGAVIWTSSNVPVQDSAEVEPVGFVSHAHTQDLAVDSFAGDHPRESLVNGATGKLLWTHPGLCAFDIGRAGAHRRPAVGLVTQVSTSGSPKTATTRVTVAARALHGSLIFAKSVTAKATAKKTAHSTSDTEEVSPFGDAQPDGSTDVLVKVVATVGSATASKTVLLSGRDGSEVTDPNGVPTDGSLQRGAGTDLVKTIKAASTKRPFMVAGYDAATGKRLYRVAVSGTRKLRPEIEYGVRLTGHHCSDLVINGEGKTGSFVGLFDAKAQPLWTVHADSDRLSGGHVTRSKRPKAFCV